MPVGARPCLRVWPQALLLVSFSLVNPSPAAGSFMAVSQRLSGENSGSPAIFVSSSCSFMDLGYFTIGTPKLDTVGSKVFISYQ